MRDPVGNRDNLLKFIGHIKKKHKGLVNKKEKEMEVENNFQNITVSSILFSKVFLLVLYEDLN